MFGKFLLWSVQELIYLRLAAHRECKDEDCLFHQFKRQVQEILSSEKLTEKKKDRLAFETVKLKNFISVFSFFIIDCLLLNIIDRVLFAH